MFESGDDVVSYTFFRNRALRSEYPRLRDVGERGERFAEALGDCGDVREGNVPLGVPEASLAAF